MKTSLRRWLIPAIALIFCSLFVSVLPTQAAEISFVRFKWDPNYSGGSILAERCINAKYHWLTSEEKSPNPRRLGSWKYGSINGCTSHYPAINVRVGDVVEIGIGASDKDPGSNLFGAVGTKFYHVWRDETKSTGVDWKLEREIKPPSTPTPVTPTPVTPTPTQTPAIGKNITVPFDWYRYQGSPDSSPCPTRNCGPAALAMAIEFAGNNNWVSIGTIRNYISQNECRSTTNSDYTKALNHWNVQHKVLNKNMDAIRAAVNDREHIVMAMVNMGAISQGSDLNIANSNSSQRYGRYYSYTGIHEVIVKGFSPDFQWVIVHDPNVWIKGRDTYADGTWKGKDRYYKYSEFTAALYDAPIEILKSPVTNPAAEHTTTKIRGVLENGKTTLMVNVCGEGSVHILGSEITAPERRFFGSWTKGGLNGCSDDYRAVIKAVPGEKFRIYSTVANTEIAEAEFLKQARRDSCTVIAPGKIKCSRGDVAPPIPDPISKPPSRDSGSCSIPFFWQSDPAWKNHPLRTAGQCSASCNTIGKCGCTLTSSAMVFKFYGADTNPAKLSNCMGSRACPFYWGVGSSCSNSKATYVGQYGFSWNRLDQEVNKNRRPVILGMSRGSSTHWIVVVKGSGNNATNYTINDPAFRGGAGAKLSEPLSRGWVPRWISVYNGKSPCDLLAVSVDDSANEGFPATTVTTDDLNLPSLQPLSADVISSETDTPGSVLVYQTTEMTMTLELDAPGKVDETTEMAIWTDAITETTWQPFNPYVELPISEEIFVRFRDENGTISEDMNTTLYPTNSPPNTNSKKEVYLPLVIR